MNSFAAIDLSQLPIPQVVEQIDYEQILAERKAYTISLWPPEEQDKIAARLELESEPLTKLVEENAYRETSGANGSTRPAWPTCWPLPWARIWTTWPPTSTSSDW